MVARLTDAPLKLTQENHPENAVEPAAQPPTVGLGAMVAICALCGLIGMAFGTAALSSCLAFGEPLHVASMLPLVIMVVCILSGWAGAFFWMCREEKGRH